MTSLPEPDRVAPLTQQRVIEVLDHLGAAYTIDSDGDVFSIWDGNAFYLYLVSEHEAMLQVLGSWGRVVGNAEFEAILLGANDIHATRLYPKIAVEPGDHGLLSVSTRHVGDFTHGVTDAQLTLHITTAISTAVGYFTELDAQFPDARPAAYNL